MYSEILLEVKGISKNYDTVAALSDFSVTVEKGEIVGLLGPNGAGKTTLISILSGTLPGFSGSVHFHGSDLFRDRMVRNRIGIVPQEMAFYEELTAADNLAFFGRLHGLEGADLKRRIAAMLEVVELDSRSREKVKQFSGGMKRRLNLAIGMLHQPELLLLDEPTVGIDVQAKVRILDIIRRAGSEGTGVIFTTHQLAEVEELCSRIVVMDHGKVLASGTLPELVRVVGEKEIVSIEGEFSILRMQEILAADRFYEILAILDDRVELALERSDMIPRVLEILLRQGIHVRDLKIKSPNLETLFLKLTGRSLRD